MTNRVGQRHTKIVITPELQAYILDLRQKGYSEEVITQTLLQAGWNAQVIQQALQQSTRETQPKDVHLYPVIEAPLNENPSRFYAFQ